MPEALVSALHLALSYDTVLATLTGTCFGLLFGILPGLSGLSALAMLLPFVHGMEPMAGLGFLLGSHAAIYTAGSVTAILLGIPGAPANAATVHDGFALQRAGRGYYAIGAALGASALGGVLGAVVLMLLIPLLQPLVLAFGAPEIFLLALVGITYVAVLGQGQPLNGLVAASFGMFLAMIGYQRSTGIPRFWFESEYLLDGIRLIPLVLGLFAIPEIVRLAAQHREHQAPLSGGVQLGELARGVRAVLRRPLLFLQSVGIGIIVGIVPGVGGETAPYVAYAAAKRRFGLGEQSAGAIEGVIAPESSNNAKEGGSLVPTLALGIPGSAAMALMLGGFLILGLQPGPDFLTAHLDMATGLGFVLAITNVVAALLMVPVSVVAAKAFGIRGRVLAPILLVLVVLGAYMSGNNAMDVVFVFVFGLLGIFMKHLNYSRPALVLGFILAPILETYLSISLNAYGWDIFTRPISLVLMALVVFGILGSLLGRTGGAPRS